MKNKILFQSLVIVTCFFYKPNIYSDAIITFFMRPYPQIPDKYEQNKLTNKLKRGKTTTYTINTILQLPLVAGIFSTYAGYLTASDINGQTIFPRKHEDPLIYLLITNRITPIMITHNTIHHWELEEGTPAALYTIERKFDEKTGIYFWDMQATDLPKNNRIPLESITIIAQPKNVYVPLGITLSNNNPQLILPDIYIRKGIMKLTNALYILNLRNFFGSLTVEYKKEPTRYMALFS